MSNPNAIFSFLLIAAIGIGVFLLIRSILLWYWKVDEIVKNQSQQTELLKEQKDILYKLLIKHTEDSKQLK